MTSKDRAQQMRFRFELDSQAARVTGTVSDHHGAFKVGLRHRGLMILSPQEQDVIWDDFGEAVAWLTNRAVNFVKDQNG